MIEEIRVFILFYFILFYFIYLFNFILFLHKKKKVDLTKRKCKPNPARFDYVTQEADKLQAQMEKLLDQLENGKQKRKKGIFFSFFNL
mgnify:CR=1 FL=1